MTTEPSSSFSPSQTGNLNSRRRRKFVGFRSDKTGYLTTFFICTVFLVGGIIFLTSSVELFFESLEIGPISIEKYDLKYDTYGTVIFCIWNFLFWILILIFPQMTTTKRDKVTSFIFKYIY